MAVNDDMKPLSGKLSFELEVKMGELITPERLALPLVILFQNSDGFVKVGKVVIELDIKNENGGAVKASTTNQSHS